MAERFPAVTFRSYLQPFLEHSAWLYLIRTTLCSQQLLEIQTGIVEDLRLDHPYAIHLKLCSWQKPWMWTWQRVIDRTISLIDPDGCSIPYVVFSSSIHRSTEIHLILKMHEFPDQFVQAVNGVLPSGVQLGSWLRELERLQSLVCVPIHLGYKGHHHHPIKVPSVGLISSSKQRSCAAPIAGLVAVIVLLASAIAEESLTIFSRPLIFSDPNYVLKHK